MLPTFLFGPLNHIALQEFVNSFGQNLSSSWILTVNKGMTWFAFLFPQLELKLRKLASQLNPQYCNHMSLNTAESVAILETAIAALTDLKAQAKAAQDALAPLAADNEALTAIVTALQEADAAVDAKLEDLAAALAPATPADPVVVPVEEVPVTE